MTNDKDFLSIAKYTNALLIVFYIFFDKVNKKAYEVFFVYLDYLLGIYFSEQQ